MQTLCSSLVNPASMLYLGGITHLQRQVLLCHAAQLRLMNLTLLSVNHSPPVRDTPRACCPAQAYESYITFGQSLTSSARYSSGMLPSSGL
jgi:hypothetical protein